MASYNCMMKGYFKPPSVNLIGKAPSRGAKAEEKSCWASKTNTASRYTSQ